MTDPQKLPSQAQSSSITNHLFWICGASSGIGYAVAERLATEGARLIIMARDEEKLKSLVPDLKKRGAKEVMVAPFDISKKETPKKAAELIKNQTLRGILLNGGGPHGSSATQLSWDEFEDANRLLLVGPSMLLKSLLPQLERPHGSVVAITSTTVKKANLELPLSGAYRTGLVAFLKNLSLELGGQGIRINNVAPGFINTQRLGELKSHVAQKHYGSNSQELLDRVEAEWSQLSALKRVGIPEEIGNVCRFLFSEESSYITGQTIVADGGQLTTY